MRYLRAIAGLVTHSKLHRSQSWAVQFLSGRGLRNVGDQIGLRGNYLRRVVARAALRLASTAQTQMCIAVVNSGANLKSFHRMDDAWVGSIDIAIKKAKTAVFFGMPTGQIGQLSQPGPEHSNEGLITFPGGLPMEGLWWRNWRLRKHR